VAQLKVIYWRDIPGRVVVREGRRSKRLNLSARFMHAIERAAYRLKKKQADAMFEPWHDVDQAVNGDIHQQAASLVRQLEAQYTQEILETLIRSSGIDASRGLSN
jgi:hypothetical protein